MYITRSIIHESKTSVTILFTTPLKVGANTTVLDVNKLEEAFLIGIGQRSVRKSPICSQVQLIPNCFEKKYRFPINNNASVSTSIQIE